MSQAKEIRTVMEAVEYVLLSSGHDSLSLLTGTQAMQVAKLIQDPYWQQVFLEKSKKESK